MPGSAELRRHAVEFEEATGLSVRLEDEPGRVLVVVSCVPLPPDAYRLATTELLFITDPMYTVSALDMFWTEPDVVRPNGDVPASADAVETYLGRPWRRFSWHRNGLWNPGRNGLLDHYEFVRDRFAQEVRA